MQKSVKFSVKKKQQTKHSDWPVRKKTQRLHDMCVLLLLNHLKFLHTCILSISNNKTFLVSFVNVCFDVLIVYHNTPSVTLLFALTI